MPKTPRSCPAVPSDMISTLSARSRDFCETISSTGETFSSWTVSALGQKQTFAPQIVMSALPPKADMCGALAYVCFGPIADIASTRSPRRRERPALRNRHTECLSRFQFDDQIEFGGLFYRQIARADRSRRRPSTFDLQCIVGFMDPPS